MTATASVLLDAPVLVLNKHWVPVKVATVLDVLVKTFNGHARILDDSFQLHDFDSWAALSAAADKPCIRTASLVIGLPEVVVLTRYGAVPDRTVAFNRLNIFKRDRYTCQYCGARPGPTHLTIDHVVPRSRGGVSSWTNCVLACLSCNRRKADRTLAESGLVLRRKPVKPDWSPRMVLARFDHIPVSWEHFVQDAYWNTALEK